MAAYRFLGNFKHSLDTKKRVTIPANFRQQLPEGKKVIITRQPEGCLAVFPVDEYERIIFNKLDELDPLSIEDRETEREWTSYAFDGEIDKQGRINLGGFELDKVRIKKEVVFVGSNRKFEIWAREVWEQYEASREATKDSKE